MMIESTAHRENKMTQEAENRVRQGGCGEPRVDALIQKAMERPGIREVMGVYEDWKRTDESIEPYRSAMTPVSVTTNRADACPHDGGT